MNKSGRVTNVAVALSCPGAPSQRRLPRWQKVAPQLRNMHAVLQYPWKCDKAFECILNHMYHGHPYFSIRSPYPELDHQIWKKYLDRYNVILLQQVHPYLILKLV
jgi:hypothetical protein